MTQIMEMKKELEELKKENEQLKKEKDAQDLIYSIIEDEYKEISIGNTPKDKFMKEWIDDNWKYIANSMAEQMYLMAESTYDAQEADEEEEIDEE